MPRFPAFAGLVWAVLAPVLGAAGPDLLFGLAVQYDKGTTSSVTVNPKLVNQVNLSPRLKPPKLIKPKLTIKKKPKKARLLLKNC